MEGFSWLSWLGKASPLSYTDKASTSLHFSSRAWEKVLLTEAASSNGAVCLDGSPGGYFISRGDPEKWVVFHQGGGWCGSDLNCAQRANTTLGSSKDWPDTYTDFYEASKLMATYPFNSYTFVYAMYCDGSSWTGDAQDPVPTPGQPVPRVYYRGRRILDAMLDELIDSRGMGQATELLYSGCSAGGLTAYAHADYVNARMQIATKGKTLVTALADAMFSLETKSYNGGNSFPSIMAWGFQAWNASASVNQRCLQAQPQGDGYKCFFGGETAQYTQIPLFVLNSKYDTWQEKAIIGVNCSISQCDSSIQAFWVNYSRNMVHQVLSLPPKDGMFVTNCPAHCQTGIDNWDQATIQGISMSNAFVGWYNATISGTRSLQSFRLVETCDIDACGTDTC